MCISIVSLDSSECESSFTSVSEDDVLCRLAIFKDDIDNSEISSLSTCSSVVHQETLDYMDWSSMDSSSEHCSSGSEYKLTAKEKKMLQYDLSSSESMNCDLDSSDSDIPLQQVPV